MSLFDRIANYFKEWDGIDETAPKMELSIHDLRYIADMNVERCRLIRQLNDANIKIENMKNDLELMKKEAFLTGIQASMTIEWTRESEEIERVLLEYGYK